MTLMILALLEELLEKTRLSALDFGVK